LHDYTPPRAASASQFRSHPRLKLRRNQVEPASHAAAGIERHSAGRTRTTGRLGIGKRLSRPVVAGHPRGETAEHERQQHVDRQLQGRGAAAGKVDTGFWDIRTSTPAEQRSFVAGVDLGVSRRKVKKVTLFQ
jgi:hypothetical protein